MGILVLWCSQINMWSLLILTLSIIIAFCHCKENDDGNWIMLGNNICYGARSWNFGVLKLEKEGFLFAIKLEHVSGYLTCDRGRNTYYASNWGCHADGDRNGITNKHIGTLVTDD